MCRARAQPTILSGPKCNQACPPTGHCKLRIRATDVRENLTLDGVYSQVRFGLFNNGSVDQISYGNLVLNTTQFVGSGPGVSGSAGNLAIANGGVQYLGYNSGTGAATSTTIDRGGFQYVGDHYGTGAATGTTINSGGSRYVGDDYGTGSAASTTISSGGTQQVGYGSGASGTATGTTISSGGRQYVGDSYGTGRR